MVGEPDDVLGENTDDSYGRQNRLIQYADGVTRRDTRINTLLSETRACLPTRG